MKTIYISLITIYLLLSKVAFGNTEVSDNCIDALHDYYQIIFLVEPNLKALQDKEKSIILSRKQDIWLKFKGECPPSLISKINDKTKEYIVSKSEFLNNLKQDTGIDIPLVGEVIPVNQPNKNDLEVSLWAANALLSTYQIDAKTFKDFDNVKKYYNQSTFEKIIADIVETYLKGYVVIKDDTLIFREMTYQLKSNIAAMPRVTFQGLGSQKAYTWRVKVPMLLEINVAERIKKEKLTVLLHLMRVDNTISEDGVIVTSFEITY